MTLVWIAAISFMLLAGGLVAYMVRSRLQAEREPTRRDAALSRASLGAKTASARKVAAVPAKKIATPIWGVKVSARNLDKTCPNARKIINTSFPIAKAPSLPLSNCPYPHECTCFFINLAERRKAERRAGEERREHLRFETEKQQRRSGRDRRKRNHNWDEL